MTICCVPNAAYLSETTRMMAVYQKLKELGEDAILATHGGSHEFVLRDQGVDYAQLEPAMTPERCAEYVASGPGIGSTSNSFFTLDELRQHVAGEVAFFKEHDVKVVYTGMANSTVLSSRVVGATHVASHAGSWVPPVIERGWQPLPFVYPMPLMYIMPKSWVRGMINWIPPRAKFHCKVYNKLAKELGVEPLHSFVDLMMGDVTLVPDIPEILGIPREELESWTPQYPKGYRKNPRLRYAGPIYAKLFGEVPEDVTQFLQTDKPKVYVALTSTTEASVRAVYGQLAQLDVAVVLCSTVHSAELGDAPNILVKQFLPSYKVMPHCDLAITTGGQGSVQTAMASGCPLLAVPIQPEQDFNVAEMQKHGAALPFSPKKLATAELGQAVMRMLEDPSFKQAAGKLQQLMQAVDGPLEAAKVLKELHKESVAAAA